jgi:acetyltransferase-like isoleucine patch superfamily enzyme
VNEDENLGAHASGALVFPSVKKHAGCVRSQEFSEEANNRMEPERMRVTRHPKPPDAVETIFDDFLVRLEEHITDERLDRNAVIRDTLYQIYFGQIPDFHLLGDYTFPIAARALLSCFDPSNVTLEPEYFADLDPDLYSRRKPLIWFWQMFDRSPLGLNVHLGFKVRQMLAPHIFKKVGQNFRCFAGVEWSFGYNLTIGDNVIIHRGTLLDDRGGLEIGNDVIVGAFARIYSHTPGAANADEAGINRTVIGDGARVAHHSVMLPGSQGVS